MNGLSVLEALGLSVIGMAIVFAVLILLMYVIYLLSAVFNRHKAAPGKPGKPVDAETDNS